MAAGCPGLWRGRARWTLASCLAIGLGFGVTSLGFFLVSLFSYPSRRVAMTADVVAVIVTACLLYARRDAIGRKARDDESLAGEDSSGGSAPLILIACLVGLVAASLLIVTLRQTAHGQWDAWAIWNLRARFFVRGGERWTDAFSPLLAWSRPDYPLLLSGAVARGWTYLGREATTVPMTIAALFTVATVGVVSSTVGLLRGPAQAAVATIILAGAPGFIVLGAWQYADVPLAFYVSASLALLVLFDTRAGVSPGLAALAGLSLGLAGWTKNEGLLAMAAVLAGRLATVLRRRGVPTYVRELGWVSVGLVPLVGVVLGFKLFLAPSTSLLAELADARAWSRLSDAARYLMIAQRIGAELWGFGGLGRSIVGPLVVLALYAALVGIRRPVDACILSSGLALGAMLLGYVTVYLLTPHDLWWYMDTTVVRLLLHLWPSAVLLYCLAVRSPVRSGPGG